ncbi:MAG: autotransporter outer membrane beta-barrel domain-containing protein [Deltaproteobacteria bacterium]|nr:autotransporter outer membrane beta-barrel domain-containing protein [Deltaproteobacteria bacterium]
MHDPDDLARLIAIVEANDPSRQLGWVSSPPPGEYQGVYWQEFFGWLKVTGIEFYSPLTGTVELDGLDRLTRLLGRHKVLTGVEVSRNAALQDLNLEDNQLTFLDVSNNAALEFLSVSDNQLTFLDVSNNAALVSLEVSNNQLTALDVSGNAALRYLYVSGNQLDVLHVADSVNLEQLNVALNRLPLSQLYPLSALAPNYRYLGSQENVSVAGIPPVPVPGTAYDLSAEASFGGVQTEFTFSRDGTPAGASDFVLTAESQLTFLERGKFEITMTNAAVRNTYDLMYYWTPNSDMATVVSTADVLPAGEIIRWNGEAGSEWSTSATDPVGKAWLHDGASGIAVRYLETAGKSDDVIFGTAGIRNVIIPQVVLPGEMTVEAGGYVFSGGDVEGVHLTLAAPSGSETRFTGQASFSAGAAIAAGNRLTLADGLSSSGFPSLTVAGGGKPSQEAVIDPGVGSVADFSGVAITWIVPETASAGDVLLKVTGTTVVDPATEFSVLFPATSRVRPGMGLGESMILLEADSLSGSGMAPVTVKSPDGHVYTVDVDLPGTGRVMATLTALAPWTPSYERMKAYPEAAAASLAFTAQGQDLLISEGAPAAAAATAGPGTAWGAFAAISAGSSRYRTGSHVDVSGVSVVAGVAVGTELGSGRLTFGAFAEAGRGGYDSFNSFPNSAGVHGNGDARYAGGGILVRWEAGGGPLPGIYAEASARTGRQETEFSTGDILYNGSRAAFRTSGSYLGLHGGIGRKWRPGGPEGAFTLDLGARVIWTRQEGAEFSVNVDRVLLEDADSLRVRAGARLTYDAGTIVSPYVGAYFEREFDGDARASVNGIPLDTPSLRGNTGMLELGLLLRPSTDWPLSIDLGARGYAGKRKGFSGTLTVRLDF